MAYDFEDTGDVQRPGRSIAASMLIAVVAFAAGAGADRMIVRAAEATTPVVVAAPAPPLDLDVACAPQLEASHAQLDAAATRSGELSRQVEEKQAAIASLEAEIGQSKKATADQSRRLTAMRAELGELRAQLREAETDRLNLRQVVTIQQTSLDEQAAQLDVQRVAIRESQADAVDASWSAFGRDAQLQICERGNRKVLGRCRETVKERISRFEVDYRACVSNGAAVPTVQEAQSAEATLPRYSRWLGENDRITRGWYAMLCDPSLPEAGQRSDGAAMAE